MTQLTIHNSNAYKRILIAAFFVLLCLFGGNQLIVEALSAENQNQAAEKYVIGTGDILEISVWNEPNLSRTVFVRLDGRISLPLVGDVLASGFSPDELSKNLNTKFGDFVESPTVSVLLNESRSKRYYVIGQIARPGEYAIDHPVKVLQAIARAGGFLEWAKTEKIIIVRSEGGKETIRRFNYDDLIKGEDLQQNVSVEPGDTIIVP